MSQTGKLYNFYFGKIWRKNWGRILIFTILIGIVWWFVIPFVTYKGIMKLTASRATRQQQEEVEKEVPFNRAAKWMFGGENKIVETVHLEIRNYLRNEEKKTRDGEPEEVDIKGEGTLTKMGFQMVSSMNFLGFSLPFNADNVFFFQQTDGSLKFPDQNYTTGTTFWKLLFDIAWWSLTGMVVLYWFIFEVFDKTFFSSREDGEETTVLTMTPGVKRSDLIWGKILAFLTFYFLINIIIFLIPFGIYYFWLSPVPSWTWFSLLALISVIVMPLLFFCLVFAPYLFLSYWLGSSKWVFSTLATFLPLLWAAMKAFTSWTWPYTIEDFFFNPIWFTIISLVCGFFFLTLYYLRYQEEDLS